MIQCRACKAEITFVKTLKGKWTPINEDGTPHWATCPKAKEFKKPDDRPKPGT